MAEKIVHPIAPIFNSESQVLILGSFPSPKSRDNLMFYGNPQNRFWTVLSKIFNESLPTTLSQRKNFALKHKIALWDVISECEIMGANDASITNARPNDLNKILSIAPISAIFTTGKTATKLYQQFFKKESIYLPSPSPANFAYSTERLIQEYSIILDYLK